MHGARPSDAAVVLARPSPGTIHFPWISRNPARGIALRALSSRLSERHLRRQRFVSSSLCRSDVQSRNEARWFRHSWQLNARLQKSSRFRVHAIIAVPLAHVSCRIDLRKCILHKHIPGAVTYKFREIEYSIPHMLPICLYTHVLPATAF